MSSAGATREKRGISQSDGAPHKKLRFNNKDTGIVFKDDRMSLVICIHTSETKISTQSGCRQENRNMIVELDLGNIRI